MLPSLNDWLRNPRLTVSVEAGDRIRELEKQNALLDRENKRLVSLYSLECDVNMRLQDILSANGIRWR